MHVCTVRIPVVGNYEHTFLRCQKSRHTIKDRSAIIITRSPLSHTQAVMTFVECTAADKIIATLVDRQEVAQSRLYIFQDCYHYGITENRLFE